MLIELILKVSVDELYWNCLDYMLLLRNGELEMNIDNVIVMWIVIGSEYVELFEFGWLVDNWLICVCCWEWCDCEICWIDKWDEDEILRYVDDERIIWAIENVDWNLLNWIELMNYVNLFVFDGNELIV